MCFGWRLYGKQKTITKVRDLYWVFKWAEWAAHLLGVTWLLGRSEYIEYLSITLYITFTTKFYSNAAQDLFQVRLNNNELAEIYQNGKWIPICGHWFWNNNKGATLFCQQLGYNIGIVKQESIARQVPLPDDGFRIGECETNDIWGQCTGGCNDHTIGGTLCSDCRSGAMAGLRIECSDGNHYRLYVLNKFSMILTSVSSPEPNGLSRGVCDHKICLSLVITNLMGIKINFHFNQNRCKEFPILIFPY